MYLKHPQAAFLTVKPHYAHVSKQHDRLLYTNNDPNEVIIDTVSKYLNSDVKRYFKFSNT